MNLAKSLAATAVPEPSSAAHHRGRSLTLDGQVITLTELYQDYKEGVSTTMLLFSAFCSRNEALGFIHWIST